MKHFHWLPAALAIIIVSVAVFAFALWLYPGDPLRFYLVFGVPVVLTAALPSVLARLRR